MSIVVYKCDVCKREKEYIQNIEGVEKIQRCTITHGCRGKMFHVKELPDYKRASTPEPVLGLDDWRQRKILYNHIQTIARDAWIIKHELGTFPSISVFINIPIEDDPNNLEEITPIDTIVVDENNMILKFDRAWSGLAQLVARQSDPNLLNPVKRVVDTTQPSLQQISASQEIVIATRLSSVGSTESVDLTVTYNTTQNTSVVHDYVVSSNDESTPSTWSDFNKVIIKGKVFTVRSYKGFYSDMVDEIISSGSTFKFDKIAVQGSQGFTARDIQQDEIYILFANTPFAKVDKIVTEYIDVTDALNTENPFVFLYDNNEFFAERTIVQSTYPPIRVVL